MEMRDDFSKAYGNVQSGLAVWARICTTADKSVLQWESQVTAKSIQSHQVKTSKSE